MEKTWRWFGPSDIVSLEMMRQIGVEGVVTSLHHLQPGDIWKKRDVCALQQMIEDSGMRWSVVESLPVSEQIKYGGPERDALIERYCESLAVLGECGIKTVCYNFMPVIDWVRTDLRMPWPDGSSSLYFDYVRFAYFDIYILERADARKDFPADIVSKADLLHESITREERDSLVDTIITRTQGFVNGPLGSGSGTPVTRFKTLMRPYEDMTKDDLRSNCLYFLKAVMPVCDKYGIDMCIHPDDPPMPVFGMPRMMCDADDIRWLLDSVPDRHNGITFCAGSLSAGARNNVISMAREFASRTHFVHLRSCTILQNGDFIEAPHIGGGVDLVELVRLFELQKRPIPMRIDHGRTMLGDESAGYNPGYSFHGRMLAFAQVCGMMDAVRNELLHAGNLSMA